LAAQEHNSDTDHCILLNNIRILARKLRHTEQLVREAKEIKLHPNINWEGRFTLSRLWNPLIHSPQERAQRTFSRRGIALSP
jgi:hypothetical protein